MDNFKLITFRRLGVENWTSEDFAEEARRTKICSDVYNSRRKALTDRGWVFKRTYGREPYLMGDELFATDPITGLDVDYDEAFLIQEKREPLSITPWPKFDNNWNPPVSTEHLFNVTSIKHEPMNLPSSELFSLKLEKKKEEDNAVFSILDSLK